MAHPIPLKAVQAILSTQDFAPSRSVWAAGDRAAHVAAECRFLRHRLEAQEDHRAAVTGHQRRAAVSKQDHLAAANRGHHRAAVTGHQHRAAMAVRQKVIRTPSRVQEVLAMVRRPALQVTGPVAPGRTKPETLNIQPSSRTPAPAGYRCFRRRPVDHRLFR